MGGLLISLFFVSSNILPSIYLLPKVPITFQVLVISLMGGLLGLRSGLICLTSLYLGTTIGLPFMSGFHGGLSVFGGPTSGYIIGFIFILLLSGLCRDLFFDKLRLSKSSHNLLIYGSIYFAMNFIGVLLCYACGSVWLAVYNHSFDNFSKLFLANLVFLPFDTVKCFIAADIVCILGFTHGFHRVSESRR